MSWNIELSHNCNSNFTLASSFISIYIDSTLTHTIYHLKVTNDLLLAADSGCLSVLSLDLSVAFNTKDHTIFLHRLQTIGIPGTAHLWFASYFSEHQHYVSVNTFAATHGVPQCSVLSPHPLHNLLASTQSNHPNSTTS